MTGNTTLIPYGIQTDESDYRFHISFGAGCAYFFPTESGRRAVEDGRGKPFVASQPGVNVVTGRGRKVPWQQIDGCQEIDIPDSWMKKIDCRKTDTPTQKGKKAVKIARGLLLKGRVALPASSREITEKQMQIRGKDLIITSEFSIEVKCDFWGGVYGLTLQTHECNPLGLK